MPSIPFFCLGRPVRERKTHEEARGRRTSKRARMRGRRPSEPKRNRHDDFDAEKRDFSLQDVMLKAYHAVCFVT